MLYLAGIVIAFFLGFILLIKKNKSFADKILAAWLFVIGTHLLFFYFWFTGKILEFPFLLGTHQPIPLLHGPFLYLYVIALTSPRPGRKIILLHFLPFVAGCFAMLPFILMSGPEKLFVYRNGGVGYETESQVFFIGYILSGVLYSIFSFRRLIVHQKTIGNYFSDTEKINLRWLRYLIIGLSAIWILVIVGNDEIIFSGVGVYLLFIGYFGINQVGIFTNRNIQEAVETGVVPPAAETAPSEVLAEKAEETSQRTKYEKSAVSGEYLAEIRMQLGRLMETDKLYKTPELVLTDVAGKLNVHPNVLSQVINSGEGKNFYNYINDLRLEEFKRVVVLPENHKFTLLSLAYECGFNSKTAFNRNFKKSEGVSPTEYLKQINITLQEQ